jgi:hypothetical protein
MIDIWEEVLALGTWFLGGSAIVIAYVAARRDIRLRDREKRQRVYARLLQRASQMVSCFTAFSQLQIATGVMLRRPNPQDFAKRLQDPQSRREAIDVLRLEAEFHSGIGSDGGRGGAIPFFDKPKTDDERAVMVTLDRISRRMGTIMEDFELGLDDVFLARAPSRIITELSEFELAIQSIIVDMATRKPSGGPPDLADLDVRAKRLKVLMAAELGVNVARLEWRQIEFDTPVQPARP